jgi:hypothetical protein
MLHLMQDNNRIILKSLLIAKNEGKLVVNFINNLEPRSKYKSTQSLELMKMEYLNKHNCGQL